MKHRHCIATLSAFLTLAALCPTLAQNQTDSVSTQAQSSAVTISANRTARVFVDGDSVGTTPITTQCKVGRRVIKLVSEAEVHSWASEPILDTVEVTANSPQSLQFKFTKRVLLNSTPSGALVFAGDSLLGTTPLMIRTDFTQFTFRAEGFEEQTRSLSEPTNVHVQLKRRWQSEADSSIFTSAEPSRSSLRLYLAGAATVVAGAASAYFKVKADNSYSDYVRTGNPSQLSETDRFDAAAGVAIAATQISLGLFTYFILSE